MWEEHFENYTIFSQITSLNAQTTFSVRTNRTKLIQNQSENKIWLIFLLSKNNIKIIQTKGWCKKMKIIRQELQYEELSKTEN